MEIEKKGKSEGCHLPKELLGGILRGGEVQRQLSRVVFHLDGIWESVAHLYDRLDGGINLCENDGICGVSFASCVYKFVPSLSWQLIVFVFIRKMRIH
eukprot:COSAG06_NODE_1228_length_10179_cov_3.735119_21_plen_98_part_00